MRVPEPLFDMLRCILSVSTFSLGGSFDLVSSFMLFVLFAWPKARELLSHKSRPDRRSRWSRRSHVWATRGVAAVTTPIWVDNTLQHCAPTFVRILSLILVQFPPVSNRLVYRFAFALVLLHRIGNVVLSPTYHPPRTLLTCEVSLFSINISFILCLLTQASYTVATASWIESNQSICPSVFFRMR